MSYTKIGRMVHIVGQIFTASVSSPVGNYVTMSLPFTIVAADQTSATVGASVNWFDASAGYAISQLVLDGVEGLASIRINENASTFGNADALAFSFSYITS